MSFQALAWATKLKIAKASDKLILLAFADRHNEESGCAYPSIAWLTEFSSLDRKTVIAAVERLADAGLLEDSGDRKGTTKQIKVYRVHVGRVPETGQSQKRNSSEIPREESQKRDTEPLREPITSEAKASSVDHALNDNLPVLVLSGGPSTNRKPVKAKAEKFVPDGWAPNPAHIAKAANLGVSIAEQVDLFRNYEYAVPKTDFDRAFHTWLQNAAGRFANRSAPSRNRNRDWDPMEQAAAGIGWNEDAA